MTFLDLPEHLPAVGYISGDEVAWRQTDCETAIDWLRHNGSAILGTEIWLIDGGQIRTAIHTKSGPAYYVSNCDPLKGERWNQNVDRSAREAAEITSTFLWPEDSLQPRREVYFNLCWADREWFRKNGKYDAYFADE